MTGLKLGTDEFGTWIGTPRRTLVRYSYGWRRFEWTREDSVRLIPHDGWWMAMFLAEPSRKDVYCDITAPAEHTASRITVVDLDIDLIRYRAGHRVVIDDEDEFEEHRRRFGYPDEVVAGARAATDVLHEALTTAGEPFGAHHGVWMARLSAATGRRDRRT